MQEALSHCSLVTGNERFSDDVLAASARRMTKRDCIVHISVWRSVAEGRSAGELKVGSAASFGRSSQSRGTMSLGAALWRKGGEVRRLYL
jgi:hypothetical protein